MSIDKSKNIFKSLIKIVFIREDQRNLLGIKNKLLLFTYYNL